MIKRIEISITDPICNCFEEDAKVFVGAQDGKIVITCRSCNAQIINPIKGLSIRITHNNPRKFKPKPPLKLVVNNVIKLPVSNEIEVIFDD